MGFLQEHDSDTDWFDNRLADCLRDVYSARCDKQQTPPPPHPFIHSLWGGGALCCSAS